MPIRYQDALFMLNQQSLGRQPFSEDEARRHEEICAAIREAVSKLPAAERQLVEMYYFDDLTLVEIAEKLLKDRRSVGNMHQRALRRLRKHLSDFVRERFGIEPTKPECCICRSKHRSEIDALINAKRPNEPYAVVIREVRRRFGLRIISPQTIIGHREYHQ